MARTAFTLTELLVSIAILIGMMGIMAMVFSTATRASGQAQTSTALYRRLRQVAASIKTELENMAPSEAIMAVAGVDQLAYETPEDVPNGRSSYHRADMLMLLSEGRFTPYIYRPRGNDEFDTKRLVVFGHANIGKLGPDGASWLNVRYLENDGGPSPIPASQWHLARRVIGFPTDTLSPSDGTGTWPLTGPAWTGAVNTGEECADVYEAPYSQMIGPLPILRGFFRYSTSNGTLQIVHYDMPHTLSIPNTPNEPCAFDRQAGFYFLWKDGYWYRQGYNVGSYARPDKEQWERMENGIPRNPQNDADGIPCPPQVLENPPLSVFRHWRWADWFRDVSDPGRGRSWLDPAPPIGQEERLAHYFLPGCTDFKVEFTWDDPREIAVDSATGEPILFDWDEDNTAETPSPQPINWVSVPPGEIWVWSQIGTQTGYYDAQGGDLRDLTSPPGPPPDPSSPEFQTWPRFIQRWPRAIRITLRAVDPSGRLAEPVTWTVTHAWD